MQHRDIIDILVRLCGGARTKREKEIVVSSRFRVLVVVIS
jgi:hypothetical protein